MAKNPLIRKYPKRINTPQPNKSAGILDDFAVRSNVATKSGTVLKAPVDDIDVVNKKYVDDHIPPASGAAGNDTEVQYNDSGAFAASSDFVWDNAVGPPKELKITGKVIATDSVFCGHDFRLTRTDDDNWIVLEPTTNGNLRIGEQGGGAINNLYIQSGHTRLTHGDLIVDTMTIDGGSITDSTGDITFGNENLSTTGLGTFGNLDVDTLNFNGNVITDSTGTISFGDENLTTTGTLTLTGTNTGLLDLSTAQSDTTADNDYQTILKLSNKRGGTSYTASGLPSGFSKLRGDEVYTMWVPSSSYTFMGAGVANDNYLRIRMQAGGAIQWGTGSVSPDTSLSRGGTQFMLMQGNVAGAWWYILDNTNANAAADVGLGFRIDGSTKWTMDVDKTDNSFNICAPYGVANAKLTIDTSGNVVVVGDIKANTFSSSDGSTGITQSETGVTDFDIVIKNGLITSFTKNA